MINCSKMKNYSDHIVASPKVLFGKPRVKGTRISAHQILECLSEGWTYKEIISQFPALSKHDITACIQYASSFIEDIHIVGNYSKSKIVHA